jgi:hypothetical protein
MEIAVPVAGNTPSRPKKVGDVVSDTYSPRTALGERLLALRRAYVMKGGKLMDDAALDTEIRRRRGQDEA